MLFIAIAAVSAVASGQKEGLSSIKADKIKSNMTFFASDNMAGRETGSPENELAALFIKTSLMGLGFKPSIEGDYLQQMPMKSISTDLKDVSFKILDANGNPVYSTDSIVNLIPVTSTREFSGKVVFAGYGYSDSTGYNDLKGIDIKDKVVVMMTRTPKGSKSGEKGKPFDQRVEGAKLGQIFMRGPKIVLMVYDTRNAYKDPYSSGLAMMVSSNSVGPAGKSSRETPFTLAFITSHTADMLLRNTGSSLKQMQEKIDETGKPVSADVDGITATLRIPVATLEFNAPNVIGVIEGSDPVLKNECVVYTAHFDHIGKKANGEVYNGADDNASGSVALLAVAEAFKDLKKPPLRTIVFAWVNGEEKGLLGSQYYTEHPLISMEKTLVDFNLDMVGRTRSASDTGTFAGYPIDVTGKDEIIIYTAHESKDLAGMLNASASTAGIKIIDKGKDLEYGGSDHESFWAKGVPAIFFHSGVHPDTHQVTDDLVKIDFDKMEKVSKMVFLLGYKVANEKERFVVDNPLPAEKRTN